MLKKIRNVLMMMAGLPLLAATYFIYLDPTQPPKNKAFWKERMGDSYDWFPYFSAPVGALLVLFAVVSTLTIMLGRNEN